jgi:hypothetical protein
MIDDRLMKKDRIRMYVIRVDPNAIAESERQRMDEIRKPRTSTSVNIVGCPYTIESDCFPTEECETNYEICEIYQSKQSTRRVL